MNSFKRNIPLLAISQTLMMSIMSLILTTVALVGVNIAPEKSLATLPLAVLFIAIMFTSIPAALLMNRIGRKAAFMFATLFGIAGGILSTYAIITVNFWLFTASTVLIGIFNGFGNYYRFTAADSVEESKKSRAISYVLIGGVLAAVIGPNLANLTHLSIKDAPFAGSYASIIILYVLILLTLSFLKLPHAKSLENSQHTKDARPLTQIARQPKFIVGLICGMLGYAMMSFVMTATPLSMNSNSHSFSDTSFIIQWHVLGMYAPSFFTGALIQRFGIFKILFIGASFGAISISTNLLGTSLTHYWFALVCLGIGWNFLFIGGTTLITETYHDNERTKTQAMNDFIIFSTVAVASLSAGALENLYGWQVVNLGVIPIIVLIFISILWGQYNKKHFHQKVPS